MTTHTPVLFGILALGAFVSSTGCSSKADDDGGGAGTPSTSTAGTSTGSSAGSSSGGSPSGTAGTSSSAGKSSSGGSGGDASGTAGSAPASSCGPVPADCTAAAALMTDPISDFETGKGWYLFANAD